MSLSCCDIRAYGGHIKSGRTFPVFFLDKKMVFLVYYINKGVGIRQRYQQFSSILLISTAAIETDIDTICFSIDDLRFDSF